MPQEVVEIRLPNGAVALARVASLNGRGATKAAALPRFDFSEVARTVEGLSQALKEALAGAAPDKVTVEVGLELAVKSGKLSGLLVEGGGKGSIVVSLEWEASAETP